MSLLRDLLTKPNVTCQFHLHIERLLSRNVDHTISAVMRRQSVSSREISQFSQGT